MTAKKVWLITGAGRGLGVDIAKAALSTDSTTSAEPAIDDYAARTGTTGADAVQALEAKAHALLAQAQAHRDLSTSLAYDET